jgi:hypothetical protein
VAWAPTPIPSKQTTKKLISQGCGGLQSSYFAGSKPLHTQTIVQSLKPKLFMVHEQQQNTLLFFRLLKQLTKMTQKMKNIQIFEIFEP